MYESHKFATLIYQENNGNTEVQFMMKKFELMLVRVDTFSILILKIFLGVCGGLCNPSYWDGGI